MEKVVVGVVVGVDQAVGNGAGHVARPPVGLVDPGAVAGLDRACGVHDLVRVEREAPAGLKVNEGDAHGDPVGPELGYARFDVGELLGGEKGVGCGDGEAALAGGREDRRLGHGDGLGGLLLHDRLLLLSLCRRRLRCLLEKAFEVGEPKRDGRPDRRQQREHEQPYEDALSHETSQPPYCGTPVRGAPVKMVCPCPSAPVSAQVVQYYARCEKTWKGTHAGMRSQHR